MNNDLLRQRRNLIIVSSTLLLFDFAEVTVTKISIMGTELLIGDAKVLIVFTWFLWGYFLLRYYQYLRAEGDLGILTSTKSLFESCGRSYLLKKAGKDHLQGGIEFQRLGYRWNYSVKHYDPSTTGLVEIESGYLPFIRSYLWKMKALLHIALHTPKLTDHVLPFLLAVAVPVVSLVKVVQTVS